MYHLTIVYNYVHLGFGSTGLDEQDITVLDDVFLTLGHDLAGSLHLVLVTELTQDRVVVRDSLDESLLKVGVNDTSGGGRLNILANGPLANLILTSGEEAGQVEGSTHGGNDLRQTRLGAQLLALLESEVIILHESQALLELSRNGKNGGASGVLLDPLEDLGEVLVLLADVISLAQVDKVHNGLGSQEEQGVDDLDL